MLESSVVLPSKSSHSHEEGVKRKNLVNFIDSKGGIPYRKISDIRFDDKKFWMDLNIISVASDSNLVHFYEENTGKR